MYPYTKNLRGRPGENTIKISEQSNSSEKNRVLLEMIATALADEKRDINFYKNLADIVTDKSDKNLLMSNYLDETKHQILLSDIYKTLSGKEPENITAEKIDLSPDIYKNLEEAIVNEIDGARFYREMLLAATDPAIRDILYEISTDEQLHSIIDSYLFSKYKE